MSKTLVVDCSVAAKWVLPEPGHLEAFELLRQEQSGDAVLIAPDTLLVEFAGLLAKKVRRKQISADQARDSYIFMKQTALRLIGTRPLLEHALDLALDNQMSLWDCLYLALAIEHHCPLITADSRLFRSGRDRHPSLQLLS